MIDKIEGVLNFIREARDEADSLPEIVMFFVAFLLIGGGVLFFAYLIVMLVFTFPKVFLPIYITIFILWQGYKRL